MASQGTQGNMGLDLDRGRRIGKYEIVTRLSVGGMAELFLAFTAGPGGFRKYVALKQILPDVQKDEHFVKMFLDEARITAALSHANIGQVFDLGEEHGELYLAMEFLAGQNLEQILQASNKQQRPLPLGFAARAVRDACLGLHYAHHFTDPSGKPRPVVHRDVSPRNVMVTFDGHVKVIDFGIAKAKGRLGRTQVGMVKGTAGYMSPEQVQGSEQLDGRSDLFCAGILLHELLCGRRLFTGAHEGEVMLKVADAQVPSPSSINPRIPEALAQVVMRSLAREPAHRFPSGREMARAIEAACGPALFHEEQMAAVMRQLFEEKIQKTRALLESAQGSESDPGAGARSTPLGEPGQENPTERLRRPANVASEDPASGSTRITAKPRRPTAMATPSRTPGARGPISRPMAAVPEPEEAGEDPLAKTQPVRKVPLVRPPASTVDEPQASELRTRPSRAAVAPVEEPRKSRGGFLILLLLLVAIGGAVYYPPTRTLLTPLYTAALEELKGEELPHGPPPAEALPMPQAPTPPVVARAEAGSPAAREPEPAPVARQEPVAAEPEPIAVAREPSRTDPKPTRKQATASPAGTEPEPRPKSAVAQSKAVPSKAAQPKRAAGSAALDEPEVIDTRTARGAAKAEFGWLTLHTIPRAAVFEGDIQLGNTPLRKVALPVNTYRLRVVDPDGASLMLSAPIKPGQVTDMTVRLSDLPPWEEQAD